MGRQRKPADASTRHSTIVELNTKRKSEAAIRYDKNLLDEKPEGLLIDEQASCAWDIVVPEIRKMEIAGNLDMCNIVGLCNAWAAYIDVTKKIGKKWNVRRNGKTVENPLINTQRKYAEELRKFERLCGITFDGRLKAGERKARKQDEELKQKFGGI